MTADGATTIRPMAPSAINEDESMQRSRESLVLMQSNDATPSPTKLEAGATGLLAITGTAANLLALLTFKKGKLGTLLPCFRPSLKNFIGDQTRLNSF